MQHQQYLFHSFVLYRNYAIADYLKSQGYDGALEEFRKDARLVCGVLGYSCACVCVT